MIDDGVQESRPATVVYKIPIFPSRYKCIMYIVCIVYIVYIVCIVCSVVYRWYGSVYSV